MTAWQATLTPFQRAAYRAYAASARHRKRRAGALGILEQGLAACHTPYVGCSFGKDSAVVLHLALQQQAGIEVRFLRWKGETEHLDTYDEVIAQWVARFHINLSVLELSRETLEERVPGRWRTLNTLTPADGYVVGLRASESADRRRTLRTQGTIYRARAGIIRICPLAWWTDDDVAAYILEHDLPMLHSYAVEGIQARTSARVPRDQYGIREQSMAALKRRDPQAYAMLLTTFPALDQYAT